MSVHQRLNKTKNIEMFQIADQNIEIENEVSNELNMVEEYIYVEILPSLPIHQRIWRAIVHGFLSLFRLIFRFMLKLLCCTVCNPFTRKILSLIVSIFTVILSFILICVFTYYFVEDVFNLLDYLYHIIHDSNLPTIPDLRPSLSQNVLYRRFSAMKSQYSEHQEEKKDKI